MTFLVLWFYNVGFSSEMLKWYFTYMEEAIQGINQLPADRLIEKYAIGGAMPATFYVEPILTYDLDVFILLPESSGVAVLTPLNEYLEKRGYYSEKDTRTVFADIQRCIERISRQCSTRYPRRDGDVHSCIGIPRGPMCPDRPPEGQRTCSFVH